MQLPLQALLPVRSARKIPRVSFEECRKILDQLEICGVRKIGLTGGEPLCHPDFFRIVEEIAKRNMVLSTLYINGLHLSDEVLSFLQAKMQSPDIQMSFDGRNTHDWMRGIIGAEKETVKAIRRSVEYGFMTHISMMLFKDNRDALMENLCFLDSLGVRSIKVTGVDELGEWKAYAGIHGLSREEVFETYLHVIPELLKTHLLASVELGGFFRCDPRKGAQKGSFEKTAGKRQ